jgi:thioredoxin-like negative regulator of GroEL
MLRRWKGSRDRGIEVLQDALKFDPFALDLRKDLASLLVEAGRRDEAVEQLEAFHNLAPNEPIVLVINANPATR